MSGLEAKTGHLQRAIPRAGKTFLLMDFESDYALSLVMGELKFVDLAAVNMQPAEAGCCLWYCVENAGWLGFINTASGTYLGTCTSGDDDDDDEDGDEDTDDDQNDSDDDSSDESSDESNEDSSVDSESDSESDSSCDSHGCSVEKRAVVAIRKVHGDTERFCVRHVASGGYVLLTMANYSTRLRTITGRISEDGTFLGLCSGCDAMDFGFIEVKGVEWGVDV
ncbi:hypothetical protein V8F20_008905 [Naviculisporaceae sp. PSN 640]